MKYVFAILFFANMAFAKEVMKPSDKKEQTIVANEGINFNEWESEFESSMEKANIRVKKCEAKSQNCQFEKFQALDPSFDMVH